jgi:hypothetical protein
MATRKFGRGVYRGITDDEYHSDCCERLSFSASDFACIATESPAHFYEGHWLNPQREEKERAAYSFGKAAHAIVLGMPVFEAQFVISPFAEFRTDESKEWRDVIAAGKTVLKPKDMEVVYAMAEVLKKTPMTANAFVGGEAELSMFWEPKKQGKVPIFLKSRPDWTPSASSKNGVGLEYKTAASAHPDAWEKAFFDYNYDIQAVLMVDAFKEVLGRDIPLGHVVQEKTKPYVVQVYVVSEKQLSIGRKRLERGRQMLDDCLHAHLGKRSRFEAWPGYFTKPVQFGVPYWIEKKETEN